MIYTDDVADDLIHEVRKEAEKYSDIAREIENGKPMSIFMRSADDFRNWSHNNHVSRLLYELMNRMEDVRIRNIVDDEEQGHEREMKMMSDMGR